MGESPSNHHKLYAAVAQVELSIMVPCSLLTIDEFLTWARQGRGTLISWAEWLTDGEAVGTQESQPAEQDTWALLLLVPSWSVSSTFFYSVSYPIPCQSISIFLPLPTQTSGFVLGEPESFSFICCTPSERLHLGSHDIELKPEKYNVMNCI